jgi:hypothetical protein
MRYSLAAFGLASALLLSPASEAGRVLPLPQVPGSIQTDVTDINDSNVVTGVYAFTFNGQTEQNAFVGTLDGQYTTFYHSNRDVTVALDISNDGYVSGYDYSYGDGSYCGNAFVRNPKGRLRDVTKNGATFDGQAGGVARNRKFVGFSCVFENLGLSAYGYFGKGYTYRADLVLPFNTVRTTPEDVTDTGIVVGTFKDKDQNGKFRAFVLADGVATAFDYPDANAIWTFFDSINDRHMISGDWYDANETPHAFLFDLNTMRYLSITVRGATTVSVGGINTAGLVALSVDNMPYIYCSRPQTCPFSPKAVDTQDKWLPVPQSSLHRAVCRNGCLVPRPPRP